METPAFIPQEASVYLEVVAENTSYRVALEAWPAPKTGCIRVALDLPAAAYLAWGDGTVEATDEDLMMLGGTVELLTIPTSATYVAVICPEGTGRVCITQGRGL